MLARKLTVLGILSALALVGCSGEAAKADAADRAFLQQMIPHHERAIEVARLGAVAATDPRVTAFAVRIVREQSPELATMQTSSHGLHLDLVAGARTAEHRITDAQLAALRALHGTDFDRQFLRLNIVSEQGAAAMARDEGHGGHDAASRTLAKNMASAPTTQIPELQALLGALDG